MNVQKKKIIFVDVDGTICQNRDDLRDQDISIAYSDVKPYHDRISQINALYDDGHEIIYWTARGTVTQIDWLDTTKKQLKDWGAKCHDVRVGKPHYDYFICDKAINSRIFFSKEEN